MPEPSVRPQRRISSWKVLGLFCLAAFLILFGVVFIPWDIKPIAAPDLELKIPELAPADNAFAWFEQAGRAVETKFPDHPDGSPRYWMDELTPPIGSPAEKWDPVFASDVLMANLPALEKFEKGLACRHYASPSYESEMMKRPWLQRHKLLAETICLKSKHRQLAGDPAGAVEPALQALRFGKMILDDCNSLTEWFVGISCEFMACERLEEIAADAKTPDPALREMLAALNQWHPAGMVDGCKNALRGQYQCMVRTIKEIQDGRCRRPEPELQAARYIPYLFKPNLTKRYMVAFYRHHLANVDRPHGKIIREFPGSWDPTTKAERLELWLKPNLGGKVFFSEEEYHMEFHNGKRFYLQAWISALRLKIALRLYENKHGQLPDDLQALVPEFITEVPNDPSADQPFRYSKEKKMVWSVGGDGRDDGGKAEFGTIMGPQVKPGYDLVMPLGTRELKPNLAPKPSVP
jgi:hypothetical protein